MWTIPIHALTGPQAELFLSALKLACKPDAQPLVILGVSSWPSNVMLITLVQTELELPDAGHKQAGDDGHQSC